MAFPMDADERAQESQEPKAEDQAADQRLARRFELWDDLSDDYRAAAARIAAFQALAEIVGVLPFTEWLERVPDFQRKQMMIAKVQDEVGHGHVMFRVAEDLGVPREQIIDDFVQGRSKLLNIFHYGFESWEELGPAALLMNSAAIVQFQSLEHGTYLPYARALRKIEKEEAFHYHHAIDLTHELMVCGTAEQRALVQQAFETWLPRLLAYFGPPDSATVAKNRMYRYGLKVDSNDEIRQRWLAKIIPVFIDLGITVDPELARYDDESEQWIFTEPDWDEVKRMLRDGGPRAEDWRRAIVASFDGNAVYRQAALRADAA
jgi:ring-1,2-phenylacetyl-CoA epoxidase subunit PaaA